MRLNAAPLGSLPGEECSLPIPDTPAWREAAAEGIDVALLYRNLRLTPERRMREHHAALRFATKMREAGRQLHGGI